MFPRASHGWLHHGKTDWAEIHSGITLFGGIKYHFSAVLARCSVPRAWRMSVSGLIRRGLLITVATYLLRRMTASGRRTYQHSEPKPCLRVVRFGRCPGLRDGHREVYHRATGALALRPFQTVGPCLRRLCLQRQHYPYITSAATAFCYSGSAPYQTMFTLIIS